jgi:hypothetical protein
MMSYIHSRVERNKETQVNVSLFRDRFMEEVIYDVKETSDKMKSGRLLRLEETAYIMHRGMIQSGKELPKTQHPYIYPVSHLHTDA